MAALHAVTAVESLADHSIDQLDDTATIDVGFRRGVVTQVPETDMVRRLNLDEKLSRAVPVLDGGTHIGGTRPWGRYLHLGDCAATFSMSGSAATRLIPES